LAGLVLNVNELTIGTKVTIHILDGSRLSFTEVGPTELDPLGGAFERTITMATLDILTG